MENLIVRKDIEIDVSPARIWEILVNPEYIRLWDELPEDFGNDALELDTKILWEMADKYVRLTVIKYEPPKVLQLALYSSEWKLPLTPGDIAYNYSISEGDGYCLLTISIGDFGYLPDGQKYYDESVKFANKALQKIKELAEGS